MKLSILKFFICPPVYFALLFIIFALRLQTGEGSQHINLGEDYAYIFLSLLEALSFGFLIEIFFKPIKPLYYLAFCAFTLLYCLLSFYYLRTFNPADFSMTFNNVGLLQNEKSWDVVWGTYRIKDWIEMILYTSLPLLSIFISHKQKNSKIFFKFLIVGFSFLTLSFSLIFNTTSFNKVTEYLQSAKSYFFPEKNLFAPTPLEIEEKKKRITQTDIFSSEEIDPKKIKNIFLIFLESFNANYIKKKNTSGDEFTPTFNALLKQGLYFENFYANSMQTAKGQFATLCSRLPHSKLKDMTEFSLKKITCLPSVLEKQGFYPIFMQALSDLGFDDTGKFYHNHGFKEVHAMDQNWVTKEEEQYLWGWGLQDDIFFKKVLDYRKKLPHEKVFMALATISHHTKFRYAPSKFNKLYPNATLTSHITKRFENSLNTMDRFLKTFFKELDRLDLRKSSLVILLGDHSFPMGEHENFYSENTGYNELFKTPLLILAPNLKPRRISYRSSQIDVVPTLLSLMNVQKLTHDFQGKNTLKKGNDVFLIQPYDGRYIGFIKNDKKYLYNVRKKRYYTYDLKDDPEENHSHYSESDSPVFREYLKEVFINDALLEHLDSL